uniref:Uncharacterized protein n=1 Tax=Tanacetum cinerariifolium TaxID=118510 RepID=A0A699QD80_TANCI|nr:hypothetical protein [Tanacetum cinerariifolium]
MTEVVSDLEYMPDDEIEFAYGFKANDDEEDDKSKNKEELSKTDEAAIDNVLDELVDMAKSQDANFNAFADKLAKSDPLVPRMVADVFEERIHDLVSDTLKNILLS